MATIDFEMLGKSIKASYHNAATQYRDDDEIEITSEHHRHLKKVLGTFSASFGCPITVLDAGCGTGRYFYCLKKVESLVGIDISEAMLEIAQNPVRQKEISAKKIQLKCENIHFASFAPGSFDFIYSLGMFGHGCPVTVDICNQFHDWLAPGGQLFFDVVDVATLSWSRRIRRKIRAGIHSILPPRLKTLLDKRVIGVPFFGLSKKELESLMSASRFSNFSVSAQRCHSPLWRGVHLECSASRTHCDEGWKI